MLFEAEVRDLTSDGRGIITTPEGLTCFVAGVWPGELAYFKLLPKKTKVQEAKLVELLRESPARRQAPCKFHGYDQEYCGGCAWQFITYAAQLEAKQQRVNNGLARIQNEINIRPVQPSLAEFSYRNRAQFKTDGSRLGFEAANSNQLIGIDDCLVLTEKNQSTLQALLAELPKKEWQSSSLKKQGSHKKRKSQPRQRWITLDIDESISAEQVSVNQRLPFQQGNSAQNQFMQTWLAKQIENLNVEQTILELFCGSGNFTEVLAARGFARIIAAEHDERAIAELNQKKLANIEAVICNLYDEAGLQSLIEIARNTDILVLDPPRDGFKPVATLCAGLRKLKKIFYISCDFATFTRDAEILKTKGFVLDEVQPVDLFPQTPHVEILAAFRLK